MAKEREQERETEFFNSSSYGVTLPERVEKRANEVCPNLVTWNTAKLKAYFLGTFGKDDFNPYWADKLTKEYSYMVHTTVWRNNRKELGDKKAEQLAIKAVNDFEKFFK